MSIQQAYSYPLTALGQSWTRPSDRTTARLDTLSHGTVSTYALGGPGTAWDGPARVSRVSGPALASPRELSFAGITQ